MNFNTNFEVKKINGYQNYWCKFYPNSWEVIPIKDDQLKLDSSFVGFDDDEYIL